MCLQESSCPVLPVVEKGVLMKVSLDDCVFRLDCSLWVAYFFVHFSIRNGKSWTVVCCNCRLY